MLQPAFVTYYDRISNILINEVMISTAQLPPFDIKKGLARAKKYKAIWDTGAAKTCITKKVVDECDFKIIGKAVLNTASGSSDADVYLADLFLPSNVYVQSISVIECVLIGEADLLIGMDIINAGDFAVSNKDGKTVFTFRTPSIERIDFVEQQRNRINSSAKAPGRNDPCFCGSGRKFKHCHGSNK